MLQKALPKRIERVARPLVGALAIALVFALMVSGSMMRTARADKQNDPPQAIQTVFTNPALITINDASTATPYPSAIVASGLGTSIPATPGSVKVTLNGFSHTFPDDVGVVLVGPTGAALNIMDGATSSGGGNVASNVTLTLSDTGATRVPNDAALVNGTTYQPGDYYGDNYPAPGPGTTYNSPPTTGAATFSSTFAGTNPNGTWSLYVVDFVGGDDGTIPGGWSLEINAGPTVIPQHVCDFDGDGKTDPAVARNTGGGPGGQLTWFIQNSGGAPASTTSPWGLQGDEITPEDFDGDNKTDIAVWRPGPPFGSFFYIFQSATSTLRTDTFGQTGDDPSVVGDYDGDGKADVAVYRGGASAGAPSFWYYRSSVNGLIIGTQWGQNGDFSTPGDFDGDGKNDFVIQRNNGGGQARFYLHRTTAGDTSFIYGTPTDVINPGDYDGDGKCDIAVTRATGGQYLWSILRSSDGISTSTPYGNSSLDAQCQGDWDGDGKTDIAVWRPNVDPTQNFFFIHRSSGGDTSVEWGQNGDYPVANFNSH